MNDEHTVLLGEGVTDPKGIFGTTSRSYAQFPDRVIETPLSENMITGALAGMAARGDRPILVHARAEFSLPSWQHIVNTLAKWRWLHPGQEARLQGVIIRMLVGRGWGQGPTHSQNFASMLRLVPGLRVLVCVDPERIWEHYMDAGNRYEPTIIIEPRRMYEMEYLNLPTAPYPDVRFVTVGDIVIDAIEAADILFKKGVTAQVQVVEDIDVWRASPDLVPSVFCDTSFGLAGPLALRQREAGNWQCHVVEPPFVPLGTSAIYEQEWYPSPKRLAESAVNLLGSEVQFEPMPVPDINRSKAPF
jgi:pyruvate/2-oxoglutarate/acetoin dehydrogenase E1 component